MPTPAILSNSNHSGSISATSCYQLSRFGGSSLWYQLWQKRLENTSQPLTTQSYDFTATPREYATCEENTSLTKSLDLNFESGASASSATRALHVRQKC